MNHAGTLRVSLLLALGGIPVACGGTTQHGNADGDTGSGGSNPSAGKSGTGEGPGKMLPPIGGATQTPTSCNNPQYDPRTGLVTCAQGYVYRVAPVACQGASGARLDSGQSQGGESPASTRPRSNGEVIQCGYVGAGGAGPDEHECEQFELGFCRHYPGQLSRCVSGCVTDQDCSKGSVCDCGYPDSPGGGVCVPATCDSEAACTPGYFCAAYRGACGSSGYACLAPGDECRLDAECRPGACAFSPTVGHRVCDYSVCGRPFLVEHALRVPLVVTSRDWLLSPAKSPRVDHLTSSERLALVEHWTKMGQMEHASIAAFARFSLQLLSLGAPPELVEACTAALADETAHTKLCFGIASAYAGRAIGPGSLDITGSLAVTSLADIVDLVIAEGCFGETGAALEALEAADSAADPVIVAAYLQIAADEQRHAELAFRFVRWALTRDRLVVANRIRAALADGEHVSASTREVAAPCLEALLATHLQRAA